MTSFASMQTVALFLYLLSTLSYGLASDGVTLLMCYRDGKSSSDSDSHAFVRVNEGSWVRPTESGYGVSSCETFKKNLPKNVVITLETASSVSEPQGLSLEVDGFFTDTVAGAIINCSGSEEDVPYKLIGSYHCDEDVKVIFSGTSRPLSDEEYSLDKKLRRKRSVQSSTAISGIVCSNGQLPPTFNVDDLSQQHRRTLGQICIIQDDEYAKTIGRVYLINSTGGIDCLPCCVDHYWNNVSKRCEHCTPGTTQKRPGFWDTCEPMRTPGSSTIESPTTTPSTHQGHLTTSTPALTKKTTTKKRKSMSTLKTPKHKPTGLNVIKKGQNFALIEWDESASSAKRPVEHYWVAYTEYGSNITRTLNTTGKKTWANLIDLRPRTCYDIVVAAWNPSGLGPEKDMHVTTLPALPKLVNLKWKDTANGIRFVWQSKQEDRELLIKAEVQPTRSEHGPGWLYVKHYGGGEIEIPLPSSGSYSMLLYYGTKDGQDGPKTTVTVEHEEKPCVRPHSSDETGNGFSLCWGFFIIQGVILFFALVYYFCQRTQKSANSNSPPN